MALGRIVSLLALMSGVVRSGDLPTATAGLLAPRQLIAGCGLDLNVWGQVTATKASGAANLCLQCRVNVLGVSVGFGFADALAASIAAHGCSPADAGVLQAFINDDLQRIAARAASTAACTAACAGDKRCQSCAFDGGRCRITAVDYVQRNRDGGALAQAFQGVFAAGGGRYCALCPSDRSCGPTATGVPRRSTVARRRAQCPGGLTACPLAPTTTFTSATPFECLDTRQELASCGGCATLGRGSDCAALPGVASAGCADAKCQVFACKPGFKLAKSRNSCSRIGHSKKISH